MDEVNINKYLAQFNPILIVPVLSAVIGAILVFVFGFKRQNELRFTTASAIDSIKKSKRKSTNGKNTENAMQSSKQQQNAASAKLNNTKKASNNNSTTTETSTLITVKKMGAANEKAGNNTIDKKKDEKKSEERKSNSGSPAKKGTNAKKTTKESTVLNNKKLKANKNSSSEEHDEKPADFDDDGWFTVTKKQQKNKNENDGSGNKGDNLSPKHQLSKSNINIKSKSATVENKVAEQPVVAAEKEVPAVVQRADEVEIVNEAKQNGSDSELFNEAASVEPVVVNDDVDIFEPINEKPIEEKQPAKPVPSPVAVNNANANVDISIAFDELGEWTDAKSDRKKGNKKKSRKD